MSDAPLQSDPSTAALVAPLTSALTGRQSRQLKRLVSSLTGDGGWHADLPVAIFDRCWLRLEIVPVQHLARRLPPDASADAPELVTYRRLLDAGLPPLEAQERCWLDYGVEACREAQARFWMQQDRGNHAWTLQRYLDLLHSYRQRLSHPEQRALPLLILARAGSEEAHQLTWFR